MEQPILKRQDLSAEKNIKMELFILKNLGLNEYLQMQRIKESER